ncbi:MAG: hypothetical protein WCK27_23195, partial [Verrucomicrobiota bacterium]
HSCPPVGLRVCHHAKADKSVRAPVARANNVGKICRVLQAIRRRIWNLRKAVFGNKLAANDE